MIKFTQKGDFSKLTKYLQKHSNSHFLKKLEQYGQIGIDALREATPKDTGLTANSWLCDVHVQTNRVELDWYNTNYNNGVPIAVILQYGHGTGTGGWVEGTDYINPAMKPIFEKISEDLWKEMTEI